MGRNAQIKSTRREIRRAVGDRVVEDFNGLANKIEQHERAINQATGRITLERAEQLKRFEGMRELRNLDQDDFLRTVERVVALELFKARGFFGRLKWLVFGR